MTILIFLAGVLIGAIACLVIISRTTYRTALQRNFFADMNHELRTPLNGIVGLTEVLLRTTLTPQQKEYLNMIRSSASNLTRAVNELLSFSRAPSNEIRLASLSPSAAPVKLRVLLAEDNVVNIALVSALVKYSGHEIEVAHNGEQVLKLLEEKSFDLILMDLQMPVLDGIETTRIIRAKEASSNKRIPIVALTAQAMNHHKEQCDGVGMDGYITKPFHKEQLETVMQSAVSARR